MDSIKKQQFSGDLFPPSSPERKRRKLEGREISTRGSVGSEAVYRRKPTLLPNGKIYQTYNEFVNGQEIGEKYPDSYWATQTPIQLINKENPLHLYKTINMADININNDSGWGFGGHVCGLRMSEDGELLAGASIVGSCFVWDAIDWNVIQMLRDTTEPEIEELYCVLFSKDSRNVFTCGKLKSRSTWSEEDGDNFCIPGTIKIYDIFTGKVLLALQGHQEEILCMKLVTFQNTEHLLSCGQDGKIIKWTIEEEYAGYSKSFILDESSHYVCSLALLPDCGNKYFVAGCDEGIKVFDFENNIMVDSFPDLYSSYCDVVKVVEVPTISKKKGDALLVSRGVELIDSETGKQTRSNKCHLWRLVAPTKSAPSFILEPIRTFEHEDYHANTWLMNLCVSTRYLLAPTTTGKVFIWSLISGQLVGILGGHSGVVRDIVFHPTKKQLITCADDNMILVFGQEEARESDKEESEEEDEENESSEASESEEKIAAPAKVTKEMTTGLSQNIVNIPSSMSFAGKNTAPITRFPHEDLSSSGEESSSERGEDSSSESSGDD